LSTRRPVDSSTRQQSSVLLGELEHDGFAQGAARDGVEQDDPAIGVASFTFAGAGDVDDLDVVHPAGTRDRQCLLPGFDREDAPLGPRRIFRAAQSDEKNRAERNPQDVERTPATRTTEHGRIIRNVTRAEIEQDLIAIVRQEKNIPETLLTSNTLLADAGIDSLDSLTILFAIEERFRISIPDDRAREMKTFGDMVTIVEELTGKA